MLVQRKLIRPLLLASLVSLAFGAGACDQDDGDACQVTRVCADGLICAIAAGSVRGTCRSHADLMDAETGDVPVIDASFGDASLDAGGDASLDAGDASEPDGANADDDAGG
jgi:hypothetical protein